MELIEISVASGFATSPYDESGVRRSGLNLVLGANGAGKTSLLEAVAVLGNLRSFRNRVCAAAVRHGERSFRHHGTVRGGGSRSSDSQLVFESGPPPRRHPQASTAVELTGRSSTSSIFPVFAITRTGSRTGARGPRGTAGPARPVRFSPASRLIFDDLRNYRRCLRQRNAALGAGAADGELAAWEEQLAGRRRTSSSPRERPVLGILADNFLAVYGSLAESRSSPVISVAYRGDAWCDAENDAEKVEETYQQRYNETRTRDRQAGFTGDGPHRHDLSLRTEGRGVRDVLSTGQAKVVAAALRLATLAEIEKERQDRFPVIVDDVDAELDQEALDRLVQPPRGQATAFSLQHER